MDPFYKPMTEKLKKANKILQYELRETEHKYEALLDLLLCDECFKKKDQVFAAGQKKNMGARLSRTQVRTRQECFDLKLMGNVNKKV